ncbi:thiJ/PfpI family protein [Burkholderia pseudomallei MSHR449]|nr:thiJ/PfpI family protein [Burkholderia pseudomallei MSHR449]
MRTRSRFLRRHAAHARYVSSVCTGALVLGAAGLLRGRRATTHWAFHSLLAPFGATPVRERVVRDGNLVTGGGVTAGIDFALTLAAELVGEDDAQAVQLQLEYAPARRSRRAIRIPRRRGSSSACASGRSRCSRGASRWSRAPWRRSSGSAPTGDARCPLIDGPARKRRPGVAARGGGAAGLRGAARRCAAGEGRRAVPFLA